MALKYPDIIESANTTETGFPIARADQISGARVFETTEELLAVYDYILSPSGNNTDNDALGFTAYITSEDKFYYLVDWNNRRSSEGWKETGGSVEPQVQTDWSQNDTEALDYIKNRTHYISQEEVTETLLDNAEIRQDCNSYMIGDTAYSFTGFYNGYAPTAEDEGVLFRVSVTDCDDLVLCDNLEVRAQVMSVPQENEGVVEFVEQVCIPFYGDPTLTNPTGLAAGFSANSQLFFVSNLSEYEPYGKQPFTATLIKVTQEEEVQKLDEKYLPETTKYQGDWEQDDETTSSYILNKPAIKSGIGTNSIEEGGTAIAYGDYSHAEGEGSSRDVTLTYVSVGVFELEADMTWTANSVVRYNDEFYKIESATYDETNDKTTLNIPALEVTEDAVVEFFDGIASGNYSHTEGNGIASGECSHAEGYAVVASGDMSHAEGVSTTASATGSHAEGNTSTASGNYGHAEGNNTVASGDTSHAEGSHTTASGNGSHAGGYQTIANSLRQTVFGTFNVADNGTATTKGQYIEIVGNGTAEDARSNARTLDWDGNEVVAGTLTIGGSSGIVFKKADSGQLLISLDGGTSWNTVTLTPVS